MFDKLMYVPTDDEQKYPFCRLKLVVETFETQLNEPTSKNSIKVPKHVKPTNMKTFLWGLM